MTLEQLKAAIEPRLDSKKFKLVVLTEPKLNKKNRTTKEPTTFSVKKRTTFEAVLGASYEQLLESKGLTRPESTRPQTKRYVGDSNWLMQSETDPNQYYVALSGVENSTTEYLIDGTVATPEQVEDLKANYLPKPGAPSPVCWLTYKIESIESIEPVK